MTRWEYLVVPMRDAAKLKKHSSGLAPEHLNELGAEGWEAVGVSLKQGDLTARAARGNESDGRGGFRTCDLSRVKRALSH